MPNYKYYARGKDGVVTSEVISASSERSVAESVRAQGLTPTKIEEVKQRLELKAIMGKFRRIKLLEKISFIKNLSVMIKAGMSVSKSLQILTIQTPNKNFAEIIGSVSRAVESGSSMSESLAKYPAVFSGIFVNMVKVGEVSGNLEVNLQYLAEQMQRDYNLISKAKSAMTYPVIVIIALILVAFTMLTFVLPKLTSTFKEFEVELPLMTRIVIAVVDIFAAYGLIILPLMVLAVVGLLYWRKTDSGKAVIHKAVLYIPIFGSIVKKINLARFLGVFSSLLRSGMPIVESLTVSSEVMGNVYYQASAIDSAKKVKVGTALAAAFKKYPDLYDPLVIQMMEVGEESGTTDAVLTEIALFYESEVDQTMKNLSSILEPVLMLIIGVVVGFLAVALISPIYTITQNVQ